MGRKIHKVHRMIACHYHHDVVLLKPQDFRDWFSKLMPELEPLEVVGFTMYATDRGPYKKVYRRWEKVFLNRLHLIDHVKLRQRAYYFEMSEAREYMDDFLEVYRYLYSRINVQVMQAVLQTAVDGAYEPAGNQVDLMKITVFQPQNLWQKLFRRWGGYVRDVNLLPDAIVGLEGNAGDFCVHTPSQVIHFHKDGVDEIDAPEDPYYD